MRYHTERLVVACCVGRQHAETEFSVVDVIYSLSSTYHLRAGKLGLTRPRSAHLQHSAHTYPLPTHARRPPQLAVHALTAVTSPSYGKRAASVNVPLDTQQVILETSLSRLTEYGLACFFGNRLRRHRRVLSIIMWRDVFRNSDLVRCFLSRNSTEI